MFEIRIHLHLLAISESIFSRIFIHEYLVSLTIAELTGGRQNISKVLRRHSNLSTTQIYLGKIIDVEAIRCIDNLHG